jgi:GNAT superfamily N-acetyltransferase
MEHAMIIRKAVEADLEQIRELYHHLNPADPLPPAAELRETWRATLDSSLMHCLVGEIAGRLVATCTLIIIPNLSRSARPYGLIENVVTHRDHRRKGLGTALLKAALDLAWEKNCYKVSLMTGSKSENTFKFYEGAGFVRGEKTAFIARPKT